LSDEKEKHLRRISKDTGHHWIKVAIGWIIL
jgi:hypothetical protein